MKEINTKEQKGRKRKEKEGKGTKGTNEGNTKEKT